MDGNDYTPSHDSLCNDVKAIHPMNHWSWHESQVKGRSQELFLFTSLLKTGVQTWISTPMIHFDLHTGTFRINKQNTGRAPLNSSPR